MNYLWVVPYAGRNPPTFGCWPDLRVQPVRRPRPTQWPAACAVLDTAPGENSRGARGLAAQGTGAPEERGWVSKGWETELPTPPSPLGAPAGPVSMPATAPTPGP